jgi:hypothetical protein
MLLKIQSFAYKKGSKMLITNNIMNVQSYVLQDNKLRMGTNRFNTQSVLSKQKNTSSRLHDHSNHK